jgi:hypothetical protein
MIGFIAVIVHCVYLRTTRTINPVIIRPHIMFTYGRQQRQPNHNTTTYCVYWRTTTTINPIIIRQYVVVLWLGLLLLSSVSKHNIWAYYDWVYCCCRPSVTQYLVVLWLGCVYWRTTTTINPVITRLHIVFTDGRQQRQPNHNTTAKHNMWSCYDWVYCCCLSLVNTICGRIMIGFIVVVVRQ